MSKERIAIIGMGGIGCYYAGMFARAGHEILALARGENLRAIRSAGLEIRTPEGNWKEQIDATDQPNQIAKSIRDGDFAIVSTKSYSLAEVAPAAKLLAERGATVLPLLNGVDAAERLIQLGVNGDRLLGGVTYISAVRTAPGIVERKTPFQRVVVGELAGGMSARAERLATIFREAGVEASATDNVAVALWQKFILLASIAAVCGVTRSAVGAVRKSQGGRRSFQRAVHEVVALGRARGIALPENAAAHAIAQLEAFSDDARPSLLLDVEAGSRTEVDVLSGAISRMAEAAGVDVPIHDFAATVLGLREENLGVH
ncbi:MAG TPA: 2-dehydropantoate 2-reductase [Gemmatimonadaceae bacterium]|nr:2-dehydropantoate 2-reductase [Gemmatimonadaceae bacterium]